MIIRKNSSTHEGYEPITEINGTGREMKMDFGLLHLTEGQIFQCNEKKERAWMLLSGEAMLEWDGKVQRVERSSLLKENPSSLHVPSGVPVKITALSESTEFIVFKVLNENKFESIYYTADSVSNIRLSSGSLGDVAKRTIRTVVDDGIASWSNMCFGEIINEAGRWSSYPPHYHPQPEIYHYRFIPENGFGYSEHGDEVFKVRNGDTAAILPDVTHPQVSAPGYSMFYVWAIPHLPENRFKGNSRIYEKQHEWILEEV